MTKALARGTNHTFKSKPVLYRGHQMRSRLEARWAMVFDALGIAWQYEPHCFRTKEGGYLPDFRLVLARPCWLEIKGPEPIERDYVRAREVQRQTGEKLRFLVGTLPAPPSHGVLRTRILAPSGRWSPAYWRLAPARTLDVALTAGISARFE